MEDVTGGRDEPKHSLPPRRRGLGKGLGAILPPAAHPAEHGALRDALTGLPNRASLDERFEEAVARCRDDGASLAVLVVALDGFSKVNELFGHRVGDDLLKDAAARL
jgi:GGDEF domain-containing protein